MSCKWEECIEIVNKLKDSFDNLSDENILVFETVKDNGEHKHYKICSVDVRSDILISINLWDSELSLGNEMTYGIYSRKEECEECYEILTQTPVKEIKKENNEL